MKTLTLFLLCSAITSPGLAQGTVNFANNVAFLTPADRLVYFDCVGPGGTPIVGTNIVAQLFYGADASSLTPLSTVPHTFRPSTTTIPGTWMGATRTFSGFNI